MIRALLRRPSGLGRRMAPWLLLGLSTILAFRDVLSAQRGLFFRDHIRVFRPRWFEVGAAMRAGELPVLTAASPEGVPLENLLNGTFTPFSLLFWGDFEWAYDALVIAHFAWLAVGAYLLLRTLRASPSTALLGAAVLTWAGPIVSTENLVVMLMGLSYTPWLCLFAIRCLQRGGDGTLAAAFGLLLGFQLQSITPIVLFLDLALGAFFLVRYRRDIRPPAILALSAATLAGLAVAAIELWPVLEHLAHTRRGAGFPYPELSGWALNPLFSLEFIAPNFWAPVEHPFLNVPVATGSAQDPPYFVSLYLGTALPLAVVGALQRRGRPLFLAVVIVSLVAMGAHTPLHRWLVSIGPFALSRYAVKYSIGIAWLVAALTMIGFVAGRRRPGALLTAASAHLAINLSLLGVTRSAAFRRFLEDQLAGYGLRNPFAGIDATDFPDIAVSALQHRATYAATMAGLLVLVAALARCRPALHRSLPFLVAADLAIAAGFVIRGADIEAQHPPADIAAQISATAQRYYPEATDRVLPPVTDHGGQTRFEDLTIAHGRRLRNPYRGARRYLNLGLDGLEHPVHRGVFAAAVFAPPDIRYRALAQAGVRYLSTWKSALPAPAEHRFEWRIDDQAKAWPEHLYELPARPYLAAYATWRRAPPDASRHPLAETLAAAHSAGEAVVFAELPAPTTATASAPRALVGTPADTRSALRATRPRIDATIDAAHPSVVVLQEVAMPRWQAYQDDRPAPTFVADGGFVATWVPAGRHRISFRYESRALEHLPLSVGTTLLLLVCLMILPILGRGRRRPP